MFNKKSKKNELKNESIILDSYNAHRAHKIMVSQSGGGINNLLQDLDDAFYTIEVANKKIEILNCEINNLESKLVELNIMYNFKNDFFFIKINKFLFFDKIKKLKIVKFYINNYLKTLFLNKNKNKNKLIKQHFSFKKLFKFIVLSLNLLFLFNNILNNINNINKKFNNKII